MTRLTGTIHPESGQWHFDAPIVATRGDEEIQIAIQESVFTIRVTTEGDDEPNFEEVWLRAASVLRAVLDALGFHLGAALEPQLLSGTVNDRAAVFKQSSRSDFATLQGSRVPAETLQPYVNRGIDNPHLRHALADVRQAQLLDDDTAFYCYRAIESLRQHYVVGDEEDSGVRKASWEQLRAALNVTESELREIADGAKPRRHGGDGQLEHAKKLEYLKKAKELVGRFVDSLAPLTATTPEVEA